MKISTKLKERFCKDCGIPIKLFKEPFFRDRLKLYDPFYNTLSQWDLFVKELQNYETDAEYFAEADTIRNTAIQDIQATDAFKEFNNMDFHQFNICNTNLPSKDIFRAHNDGKMFLSIDMKKANFSALYHYNPSIFNHKETWEDFIGQYTSSRHIINSKYTRQVILGNCNPKRQTTYEKFLMDKVIDQLSIDLKIEDIVFFSNDEIVYSIPNNDINAAKNLVYLVFSEIHWIPVKVQVFTLHKISEIDGFYKKIYTLQDTTTVEFKCINSLLMPFVIRAYLGQKVHQSDLVFYHEGYLAKMIDYPKIILEGE